LPPTEKLEGSIINIKRN